MHTPPLRHGVDAHGVDTSKYHTSLSRPASGCGGVAKPKPPNTTALPRESTTMLPRGRPPGALAVFTSPTAVADTAVWLAPTGPYSHTQLPSCPLTPTYADGMYIHMSLSRPSAPP